MYKGSFDRVYPRAGREEAKAVLRGILRHEFRHHLEFLAGIHDASSLEAQDKREKLAYLAGLSDEARAGGKADAASAARRHGEEPAS